MEDAKKKKYSRDGENPTPWPLNSLGIARKDMRTETNEAEDDLAKQKGMYPSWEKAFYPASKFAVKNYVFSKASSIDLPGYMYMSKNYYEPQWGFKTHRRLKNIIVVMEFAPSKSGIREVAQGGRKFTQNQERNLRKAFSVASTRGGGNIAVNEVEEVLAAVDVDIDEEEAKQLTTSMMANANKDGTVSFDQLKDMLLKRMYQKIQDGRYYVALSLAEAECLRAALHQQVGMSLFPGRDTIVAMRSGRTLIDKTLGYEPAAAQQHSTAQCCYRYLDSQVNFSPKDLNYLVRALQENDCSKRLEYFLEVRSNRRRKNIDPNSTSLAKVFVTNDEHHLLQFRICAGRITALLKSRGMYPRDAFAVMDNNRDGLLSMVELSRGLEWLGLKLDPSLIREFMANLDEDNDGYINLDEFKGAVSWEEDGDGMAPTSFNVPMMPQIPDGEGDIRGKIRVPEAVLASIKIKLKTVSKFSLVWNSQGSMSREKGSVWEPSISYSNGIRQKKVSVALGHFAGINYDNPNRDNIERQCLEISDTSAGMLSGSDWLPHVLDKFLPHPARFRLVWSLTHGSNPFYAWEPVPPNENFVALGMVGGKKDEEPSVKCVRCVPASWVQESRHTKRIWSYNGAGGRQGSMWVVNKLYLISFVSGQDPPRKALDFKSTRFFMKEYTDIKTQN